MAKRPRVEGARELERNLREIGINAHREVQAAVDATATEVRSTAIRSLQKLSPGSIYDVQIRTINGQAVPIGPRSGSNLSATHQASAPGDPPNTDTGALASALYTRSGNLTADVYSDVDYAPHLEFGTQNMAARPFLWPALRDNERNYIRRLDDLAARAARGIDP